MIGFSVDFLLIDGIDFHVHYVLTIFRGLKRWSLEEGRGKPLWIISCGNRDLDTRTIWSHWSDGALAPIRKGFVAPTFPIKHLLLVVPAVYQRSYTSELKVGETFVPDKKAMTNFAVSGT